MNFNLDQYTGTFMKIITKNKERKPKQKTKQKKQKQTNKQANKQKHLPNWET